MNEDKPTTSAKSVFTAFLKSRKLRRTSERELILDTIMGTEGRFTAEEIHTKAQPEYHVSKATVYNTLQLLIEAGLVKRMLFNGGFPWYEKSQPGGDLSTQHLVCTECGRVKEFKDVELSRLLHSRRFGAFHISHHSICVYGVCSRCARRMKKRQ